MSVLVLAGVEVVSDDRVAVDKVDENVMVEAKLVVVDKVVEAKLDKVVAGGGQGGGARGGRGWRVVGLVSPSSSSSPEKDIINHSDVKMCSKIIRKIIATFLKNILHSCKNR